MDDIIPPQKQCTKCLKFFSPTAKYFYASKVSADGLRNPCKECCAKTQKQHNQVHKEEISRKQKHYYQNHREKILAHAMEYQRTHREARSAYSIKYNRRYRQIHRDKIRPLQKQYRQTHLEEARAYKHNRRARKRNNGGTHSAQDIQKQYDRQKGKCYYCSIKMGTRYHVDHVIPLARGGSNGPENLVIACPKCNSSKQDKFPHEWPEGGRLL